MQMTSDVRGVWVAAVCSLAVHATLAVFLVSLPPAEDILARVDAYEVELVVPPILGDRGEGETGRDRVARTQPPEPGGGAPVQSVDAEDRGQGGDRRGAGQVILLLPRADDVLLQDSPMNAWRAGQTQRIRTADDRASRDSRRATPSPLSHPFLASGEGAHRERRPVATTDARDGARIAPRDSAIGQARSTSPALLGQRIASTGGTLAVATGAGGTASERAATAERMRRGSDAESPGRGILDGRGARASEAARVAHGRPPVDQGRAATQAQSVDARIRDDEDAELLAAQMVQSLVESSPRSGAERGAGRGGVGGGGAPGTRGGQSEGGSSRAMSPGSGAHPALDTSDARYVRWYLQVRDRVSDALEFPRERALAMDQGLSVYTFTVRRDGSLVGRPRPIRGSGFADFDTAARRAIETAAPFPPLPAELAEGLATHTVRMTVEHSNPMVH